MTRGPAPLVLLLLGALVVAQPVGAAPKDKDDKRRKAPRPEPVHTYPAPGWGFASAKTRITFRGDLRARDLRKLEVRGSISGRHDGYRRNLRNGWGAVFNPEGRFEPGETVTVRSPVPVVGAHKGRRFEFVVARTTGEVPADTEPHVPAQEPWLAEMVLPCELRRRTLETMPALLPEGMCTVGRIAKGHGRLLLSLKPRGNGGLDSRWAAAVLSRTGKLLWYTQAPHELNDLKSIVLDGRRLLALFVRPKGQPGAYELLDETYRPAGRIEAGNGYAADSHDLQVGEDGTVWIGVYEPVWRSGRRRIVDYVVQQLDPLTGDVLFEWHALDHVPPQISSYRAKPRAGVPWDYFHGNAIQPPSEDDPTILVSARNTSAIYGIHPQTGAVEWILGGRRDRFDMDEHPRRQFCAQHDVRRVAPREFTLFDNGGTRLNPDGCPIHPARAMHFRIDPERRRARLLDRRSSAAITEGPTAYYPGSLGGARLARDGSWLVDWGTAARVTQQRRDGRVGFRMALGQRSYRAVLARWRGMPAGKPAVALARPGGLDLDVFASWNGATEVGRWQLLAGPAPDRLQPLGAAVRFADLETAIRVQTEAAFVAVRALGRDGTELGESDATPVPAPPSSP